MVVADPHQQQLLHLLIGASRVSGDKAVPNRPYPAAVLRKTGHQEIKEIIATSKIQ